MNLFYCCCNTMAPNTRITRKWELFAGRNKFYCDGLLMSAPHTGVFYLTCFLITGTSALFFAFDCPYLATRITPAIPIVGVVLYFFTMSSLLRTTFTDPGVIPRASHDEAAYIEKQIEVPNSLNSPTYRPPPRTKEVLVKGQTVKLKYCFTCKIFRPPRASHCSLCDNCVDRFDHHCPWVGNCVGKRNYRFFYMFLVSLAFLAVFIFSCSVTHLVLLMKMEQEVLEVIKKAPFSVVVTFICFFSIWSVIGLAGFHTYLTTSDQTTNEDLKGSFSSKGGQRAVNPYSRGNICLNCVHILCGPMTPSLIDRRGIVTDEYISQMQHNPQNPNNQLLSELTSAPSPLITNQPSIAGIEPSVSGKHRMFDDNNPGIYRHRSYDNLQNGNSNSLARLVDNEVPLSQRDGPTVGVAIPQQQQQQHYQQQQQYHQQQQQISPTITDDDTLENNILLNRHKRLNNLSGSYNNLFRDNIDSLLFYGSNNNTNDDIINCLNDDYDKDNLSISDDYKMINDQSFQSSSSILLAATASLPTSVTALAAHSLCHPMKFSHEFSSNLMMNTSGTRDSNNMNCGGGGIGRHHRIITNNLRKSASESENVYSNIPNSNISSSAASSNGSNKSDPNLHVYSNLIEEHQHQQEQQQQEQSQNQQLQKQKHQLHKQKQKQQSQNNLLNTNNKQLSLSLSKLHDRNNEDNLFATTITAKHNKSETTNIVAATSTTTKDTLKQNLETIPSTLLTNDLDLDDPVSAFVVNNSKKFELSSNRKIKNRKGTTTSEQQQHNAEKNDVEMKSDSMTTSNSQTLVTSPNQSSAAPNTVGSNGKERDSAGAAATSFITPSRLRLLQDTTMINTALDLDSLDGSSIGNNSQSCLIKTAMV